MTFSRRASALLTVNLSSQPLARSWAATPNASRAPVPRIAGFTRLLQVSQTELAIGGEISGRRFQASLQLTDQAIGATSQAVVKIGGDRFDREGSRSDWVDQPRNPDQSTHRNKENETTCDPALRHIFLSGKGRSS